jgi:hypothetical protein
LVPFTGSDLAKGWAALAAEEACAVGTDVTDTSGLGDPSLHVAKLFPLNGGKEHNWFLDTINITLLRKNFFWVTYIDDGAEYRNNFYNPKSYGAQWCYVRKVNTSVAQTPEPVRISATEC